MAPQREVRPSDSPHVRCVTRVAYSDDAADVATPDGLWDLVVVRGPDGPPRVVQTGVHRRPLQLDFSPGNEYVSISFEPGVFMPRLPGSDLAGRAVPRPVTSPTTFWLDDDPFEIPTFDNAEGLIHRLTDRGHLVVDELVLGVLRGRPADASTRTVQRHFLRSVGMPPKQLQMIRRANLAVESLQRGVPPAAVAFDLDYADQSHLSRSLKEIMGRTPGEIARAAAA